MERDKYKRHSIRLKEYNYSSAGGYFITLCVKDKELCFTKYPTLSKIVKEECDKLPIRFPDIKLDEFVVMPNHIHGIIFVYSVGAIHELPLRGKTLRRKMLLPKIIGYFKMNTAKQINKLLRKEGQPFWQRNYFEHIIQDEKSLNRIREYIYYNPLKWELDRENPEHKKTDEFDKWLYK